MSQAKKISPTKKRPKQYLFQKRQRGLAEKIFEKGFNAAAYVLFSLKESGEGFLRSLPSSYPGFALLKDFAGAGYKKPQFKPSTIRSNLFRLQQQGLVAKDPKEKIYFLTEEGKKFTAHVENRYLLLKNPWDKKLRIVIFDIPENKRWWRAIIRDELLAFQYQQLQKSVYIGKYPLPESFRKEIEEGGIGKHIFIFTIDQVDREDDILKLLEDEN